MATGQLLLRAALALATGLVLGSVLPADLLARRRGVDIRATGDGNPGTVNAVRALGWVPGLITAAYDLSVGVVAIQIAYLLGLPEGVAYVAGTASVVGHRFPVFRGFRGGGQGMAASAGLLLYGVAVAMSRGWLSMIDVGVLVAILLVTFALTRSDSAAAVVMLPLLVVRVVVAQTDWQLVALLAATAGYIWVVQIAPARRWFDARTTGPAHGRSRG
jgi:acyl phosphate:glycerol-3-phosphate acyltransferase